MNRQRLLSRDDSPTLWVILDEAVLRRPVGGPGVMREQIQVLDKAVTSPNVTLHVLPFASGDHAGMDGGFTIFGFSQPAASNVVHLDTTTGDLYFETAEDPAVQPLPSTPQCSSAESA